MCEWQWFVVTAVIYTRDKSITPFTKIRSDAVMIAINYTMKKNTINIQCRFFFLVFGIITFLGGRGRLDRTCVVWGLYLCGGARDTYLW